LLCCCSSSWEVISQNTAIFANFDQFHHAFVIDQNIALLSNFTMHSAALPGRLARQDWPAALTGSLDRQPWLAALTGSLDRQPWQAALTGSLDRQPWPAALPGSSTNFDRIWCTRSLAPQVTKLHARDAMLSWQV
jgi:hypothetical protein